MELKFALRSLRVNRKISMAPLGSGVRLAGAGMALGVLGAFAATRLLRSMLFGVETTDSLTYATMAVAVMAISLLACAIPAWRAATVDPLMALRQD